MPLTILGFTIGTLPAWMQNFPWLVPAVMVHIALFLALIVPAWVGLARARAGGPLSLVLVLPILGLLMLTPIYMNRVLPYAHWGRFWGILVLIPGLNIFFLWIFAFAPWKRRYIPLDQEEYSEVTGLPSRTGRSEPRLEGHSREPEAERAGSATIGPGAPGFTRPGEAGTMLQGSGAPPLSPRSGEPGTMMAGAPANPPPPTGKKMRPAPSVSGPPPEEPPAATMIAGREGAQPLDEPVTPTPPIPARSLHPPQPPAPPPAAAHPVAGEPPRPRRPERTLDVTGRPPAAGAPEEAATMRVTAPPRAGGRAWRLVGANDVAASFDFTVQEPALLDSDAGLLVGRSARANFVIEHDSVSRNHARFLLEQGALCLEDLDSMNGTWVDGQKLEPNTPVPLQPGGIVEIGKIKLRVTGG
jgi:hypothetical protein